MMKRVVMGNKMGEILAENMLYLQKRINCGSGTQHLLANNVTSAVRHERLWDFV